LFPDTERVPCQNLDRQNLDRQNLHRQNLTPTLTPTPNPNPQNLTLTLTRNLTLYPNTGAPPQNPPPELAPARSAALFNQLCDIWYLKSGNGHDIVRRCSPRTCPDSDGPGFDGPDYDGSPL